MASIRELIADPIATTRIIEQAVRRAHVGAVEEPDVKDLVQSTWRELLELIHEKGDVDAVAPTEFVARLALRTVYRLRKSEETREWARAKVLVDRGLREETRTDIDPNEVLFYQEVFTSLPTLHQKVFRSVQLGITQEELTQELGLASASQTRSLLARVRMSFQEPLDELEERDQNDAQLAFFALAKAARTANDRATALREALRGEVRHGVG